MAGNDRRVKRRHRNEEPEGAYDSMLYMHLQKDVRE